MNKVMAGVFGFILMALMGCQSLTEPSPKAAMGHADEPNHTVVRVFYATDRNPTGQLAPSEYYGGQRAPMSYGWCAVSMPREHIPGVLESPSIWRLEFRENPDKHVMLLDVTPLDQASFFGQVAGRVKASAADAAFVFVHGYNVSFEDAARRTAQITYDLGFDGAPVFYSWPSQGRTSAYTVDEQNIEWAQANIQRFLSDFFVNSQSQNVYLIGHSMGTRGLTRVVANLMREQPELKHRLKEVILAAPDIDAEVFKRDIAPAMAQSGKPVTLYASSNDIALKASKAVHGYPRAGDSGRDLVIVRGVETVDASGVKTDFLGHSYIGNADSVLADLYNLIQHRLRPDQRPGLAPVDGEAGRHWEFK